MYEVCRESVGTIEIGTESFRTKSRWRELICSTIRKFASTAFATAVHHLYWNYTVFTVRSAKKCPDSLLGHFDSKETLQDAIHFSAQTSCSCILCDGYFFLTDSCL